MAYKVNHEYEAQATADRKGLIGGKDYDYNYGELGKKLRPGADLHEKLVKYGLDIANRGVTAMSAYHPLWTNVDWKVNGYVTPEQADPRNNGEDGLRNIVLPMSFKMEEMYCAASKGVFIQDPIFKWKPFPGADSLINAAVAEYMIQRHCLWFNFGLHADSVTRYAFRYGIGMSGLRWRTERARKPVDHEINDEVISAVERETGEKVPRKLRNQIIRDAEEQIVCEGSEVQPWEPYSSFYDTSVTPNNLKDAAWLGTVYECDSTFLEQQEREMPGRWFNAKYARDIARGMKGISRFNRKLVSGRETRQATYTGSEATETMFSQMDVIYIECLINPKEWEVGEEDYPVKYFLAIAADEVLVGFGPLDLWHGGWSADIMAPNADGHTYAPISHLLTTIGIQDHADDIMRCTMASIKKNINGGWTIVNHNILNWDDITNNDEPGKLIRPIVPALTKEMMEAAILQIPHMDKSPEHMRYMNELMGIASDGNGTVDIGGPGALADSERPTKFGMMAQVQSTSSRFQRLAYKKGQQWWGPNGWKMVYNLLQFGKQKQQVDLAGRMADRIRREMGIEPNGLSMMVDPRMLDINFEMEPYTGAMPQMQDLSGLTQVITTGMAIPEIAMEMTQGIPWAGLMKTFIRKSGVENIDDYPTTEQVSTTTLPDDMIQQQAQAGNLVPIGQMRGVA